MANARDPDAVAEAAERDRFHHLTDKDDLIWLMSDLRGRRWVWNYLSRAGVYALSFAGEQSHATAFNEGRRSEGVRLMAELAELLPERYLLMIAEARQRDEQRKDLKDEALTR